MVLAVFAPLTAASARTTPSVELPRVSPAPQSMRPTGTDTVLSGTAAVVTGPGSDAAATATVTASLRATGAKVQTVKSLSAVPASARLTVFVGGLKENSGSGDALRRLKTTGTSGLPKDGYVVASGPDGHRFDVVLAGADPAGTFYAAQTFRQLVHKVNGKWHVPGVVVRDEPGLAKRGMIEGFYGAPWTTAARTAMMQFAGQNKMNSYVYAPKLDPYHREKWREPYPADQLKQLGTVVKAAQANHVDFTFAVSPGLSICFSDAKDFAALEKKTQAMYDLGVRSFAIFFDDITPTLGCDSDKAKFGSDASPSAAAQAYLLNEFRDKFVATHPGTEPLGTVPTEYNGLKSSPYKTRFAALVDPDVQMYWTGTDVVSATISDADIANAKALFKHPIQIWDNYPVNDFESWRLFLGPVSGRGQKPADDGAVGYVANPTIQPSPSRLPLTTNADMAWNPAGYDPKASWDAALNAVGGSASDALRTFADNNLSSGLTKTESPDLAPGITAFEKEFAGGAPSSSATLAAAFDKVAAATPTIQHKLPAGFSAQAASWLMKSQFYGTGGAAAVRSLTAQKKNDDTTAWKQRVALDTSVKAALKLPVVVGDKVIEPFLTWSQQQSDRVSLASPAPGGVLEPGSDVTLTPAVKSGSVAIKSVRFYAGAKLIGTATKAPWKVVWHNAPRRVAQITVKATDATGATVPSAPVNLTIGKPDAALLVTNAAAPTPGEQAIGQRLNYLGLAVTTKTAADVTAADTSGDALVDISPDVVATDLKDKLTGVKVPMVVAKSDVYPALGMAKAGAFVFAGKQADFKSSPLSAGLTGTVDVYQLPGMQFWGAGVAPSAIVGATVPATSDALVLLFGYEKGATMTSGAAPARRVGIYLGDTAFLSDEVKPASLKVFDASVDWALSH